jgi:hypothetical protein
LQIWRDEVEREAASLPGYTRYYARILDEQGRTIVESPGMGNIIEAKGFPEPLPTFEVYAIGGVDGRRVRKALVQVASDRSHDATIIADYRSKMLIALFVDILPSMAFGFASTRRERASASPS